MKRSPRTLGNGGRTSKIQTTENRGGARVWSNQTQSSLQPIFPMRARKKSGRLGAYLCFLKFEKVGNANQNISSLEPRK